MTILFLYSGVIDPIRGGVQRITYELASYLEKCGHKILFLAPSSKCDRYDGRQFVLPKTKFKKTHSIEDYYVSFLKEHQIDLVINQSSISPSVSKLACIGKDAGVKLISVIHNSLLSSTNNFYLLYEVRLSALHLTFLRCLIQTKICKKILTLIYKCKYYEHYTQLFSKSDRIVVLSEGSINDVAFFSKESLSKTLVIPNFVQDNNYIYNKNDKYKQLLYVGRLDTKNKRIDLLLNFWDRIYKKHSDWELNIVGGGPEKERIVDMAKLMDLKNINFVGFADPSKYFKNASIFCMPSISEGFGLVMVEAMSYGVVPIAFDSYPSAKDIIDDNINGFLVSPFNAHAFEDRINELISDNEKLNTMAKNAIEKSLYFSISIIGKKWDKLFNDLRQSNNINE